MLKGALKDDARQTRSLGGVTRSRLFWSGGGRPSARIFLQDGAQVHVRRTTRV